MLSLHFKPMLLEDVANSRDFIVIPPMPYGQRASSNMSEGCSRYRELIITMPRIPSPHCC